MYMHVLYSAAEPP